MRSETSDRKNFQVIYWVCYRSLHTFSKHDVSPRSESVRQLKNRKLLPEKFASLFFLFYLVNMHTQARGKARYIASF